MSKTLFRPSFPAEIYADLAIGDPLQNPAYAGNLKIDSVGIDLPCIETSYDNADLSQIVTDKRNCAAMMWCILDNVITGGEPDGTWIIADHDWQGFSCIMDCQIGDMAVFTDADGTEYTYTVQAAFDGYIGDDGEPVKGDGSTFLATNPANIVLMVCHPDADVAADREARRFFVYLELE